MKFTDAVTIAGTRRTDDGYLVAEAKAVRTGIQLYTGDEVGKPEMPVVRVYRPPESVFSADSLQSFTHAPVTMDHPKDAVTADNWKQLAVGEVSTAAKQDGDWVYLPLILKDAAAIKGVEGGKRELSAGYVCELVWGDGTTPDGLQFDAQQANIKINHLAVVDRARAGSQARIGDAAKSWGATPVTGDEPITPSKKEDTMSDALKTVVLGDKAVQVAVSDVATFDAYKAEIAKVLADTKAGQEKALAAKDAELAKKDAEIDALNAKVLSDADIDKRVADRADLVALATSIAKDVKTAGLSDAAIRKAVVAATLGDAAVADKAEAYIDARFDILVEDAKKAINADPFAKVMQDGIQKVGDGDTKVVTDAYTQMVADLKAGKTSANG